MKPKISVIMSVYNAEKYVAKAIDSILNQTFEDFEFIVINDASKDNSLNIICRYIKKDNRILLINNKTNIGLTKSLNKGLKIAKGKYIARMDADDISLPNRFQKQFTYLEDNADIFLLGSSCFFIDEKGVKIGSQKCLNNFEDIKKRLKKSNCIIHPSVMFRNDKKTEYREKMWYVEDYDLYLNLLTKNKKLVNLQDMLILYRITSNSITKINSIKRKKFACKAIEFYNQRIRFGKDKYNEFDPSIFLCSDNIKEHSGNKVFIRILVEAYLKNGNFKMVRKILFNKKIRHEMPFFIFLPYALCAHVPIIYKIYRFCFFKGERL